MLHCLAVMLAGTLASVVFLVPVAQKPSDAAADRFWPQWRGPHATGVSKTATPPLEWSDTKNIRWKVEIPAGAPHPR